MPTLTLITKEGAILMRYLLIALFLTACTPPERPIVWCCAQLETRQPPRRHSFDWGRERCCPEWTPQPEMEGYDP